MFNRVRKEFMHVFTFRNNRNRQIEQVHYLHHRMQYSSNAYEWHLAV